MGHHDVGDELHVAAHLFRLAALYVGVASPDAAGAGAACTTSMVATMRSNYVDHEAELEAEGIRYLPVVWSAHGWPHPDTSWVLLTLAR